MMLVLDIDPQCIFGGYVSGRYGSAVYVLAAICSSQIMSKRRTATLENCKQILGWFFAGVPPSGLCLFPWLIYKVLHLLPCSNLVLWGAICYTIFSHWFSHLDIEPKSSLVTLTPCLPVTFLHFLEYLIDLCLVIRQVLSLWSNLEMPKKIGFFPTVAVC